MYMYGKFTLKSLFGSIFFCIHMTIDCYKLNQTKVSKRCLIHYIKQEIKCQTYTLDCYSYIDFYYRAVFNIFEIRTAYFIEITKSKLRLYVKYINSKYFTYMSTACIVNIKTTRSPGSDEEGRNWMQHHVLDKHLTNIYYDL